METLTDPTFEREKWEQERNLKEREIILREREFNRSRWLNPLVLAVTAAAIAGAFNAWIALKNGRLAIDLEDRSSQLALIVDQLDISSWEESRRRMVLLADMGVIADHELLDRLERSRILPSKSEIESIRIAGANKVIEICGLFPTEDNPEADFHIRGFYASIENRAIISAEQMSFLAKEYSHECKPFQSR